MRGYMNGAIPSHKESTVANLELLKKCFELAKICKAVYAGPIRHSIYSYQGEAFESQKIIHGSFGRGYCRIFWNKNVVVVAFRGTRESVDWIISNVKAFPVKLQDCPEKEDILVHNGFQRTLDYGDKTTEIRSLDAIFDCLEEHNLLDREFVIAGHSLGGALATLFAVKLRSLKPKVVSNHLSHIITFGAPSVGFQKFKDFYGELADKTTRVINNADGVPFTPPVFYQHVGNEVWLNKDKLSTDVGWPVRLKYALKGHFTSLATDHSIHNYILQLSQHVDLKEDETPSKLRL